MSASLTRNSFLRELLAITKINTPRRGGVFILVGVIGSKWNLIRSELIEMSRIVEMAEKERILLFTR